MNAVYCDPDLPADWDEREARMALERRHELAQREPQFTEPDIFDMFRRAAVV